MLTFLGVFLLVGGVLRGVGGLGSPGPESNAVPPPPEPDWPRGVGPSDDVGPGEFDVVGVGGPTGLTPRDGHERAVGVARKGGNPLADAALVVAREGGDQPADDAALPGSREVADGQSDGGERTSPRRAPF